MMAKTIRMFEVQYRQHDFYIRHMLHKEGTEKNTSVIAGIATDTGAFPQYKLSGHLEGADLLAELDKLFVYKSSLSPDKNQ